MPIAVVRLPNNNLLLWSTTVDAPISNGLNAEEAEKELWLRGFDRQSAKAAVERGAREGCSLEGVSLANLVDSNRAGPGETKLTLKQIVAQFGARRERRPAYLD